MTVKIAETSVPVHELIASRWSPRAFQDRPVENEKRQALLEAARWTPSAYNLQPWRFVVWERHRDAESFERAFSTLSSTNKSWVQRAPLLLGVFADTRGPEGKANGSAAYDTGAAVFALSLQAHSLGLHLHQLGGFNREALRDEFALPPEIAVLTLVAVGYRDEVDVIEREELRKRELLPRERLPLSQIAFAGAWGTQL